MSVKKSSCEFFAAFIAILTLLVVLSGCNDNFLNPKSIQESPSPSPLDLTPSPALPDAKPNINAFGLAFGSSTVLDPFADNRRYNTELISLCYQGLFATDETNTAHPVLALSAVAETAKTVVITLNPKGKFQNGDAVTAADVSDSLMKAKEGRYKNRLSAVKFAEAQTDGTVKLTLSAPIWRIENLLDIPIAKKGDAAIGSGLYRFVCRDDEAYLLANDAKNAPLPRIELVPADGADELARGFGQKYISVLALDPFDTRAPGIQSAVKQSYLTTTFQWIGFNHKKTPMSDPNFRRGIALATLRKRILGDIYGDLATPVGIPFLPTDTVFRAKKEKQFTHNLSAAGAALTPFVGKELSMIVDTGNPYRAEAARRVVSVFGTLGAQVELRELGHDAYLEALEKSDFDLFYAEATLLPNTPPRELIGEDGALNFGRYRDKTTEDLLETLDTAAAAPKPSAAPSDMPSAAPNSPEPSALPRPNDVLDALFDRMLEDTPIVAVGFRKNQLFSQFGVAEGLNPTAADVYYQWGKAQITVG